MTARSTTGVLFRRVATASNSVRAEATAKRGGQQSPQTVPDLKDTPSPTAASGQEPTGSPRTRASSSSRRSCVGSLAGDRRLRTSQLVDPSNQGEANPPGPFLAASADGTDHRQAKRRCVARKQTAAPRVGCAAQRRRAIAQTARPPSIRRSKNEAAASSRSGRRCGKKPRRSGLMRVSG